MAWHGEDISVTIFKAEGPCDYGLSDQAPLFQLNRTRASNLHVYSNACINHVKTLSATLLLSIYCRLE